MSLKVQSLVLYYLSCISPLSALLFHHFPWTTTFMLTTHNFFSLSIHRILTPASFSSSILSRRYLLGWLLISLTLNSAKTEFLLVGLPQQFAKINTSSMITTHSARNFGFIFDEHLTFSDQISKSCYYHIRELRCLRPYHDFKTASTIATSIVHSKLDYCNSLYYNLPQSQIKKLQNIKNYLARAVTRSSKSSHIAPVLKSLHRLNINERIKYKLLSLTYKVPTTHQPQYLHDLISVQPSHNTRSSSMVVHLLAPLWKSQIAF